MVDNPRPLERKIVLTILREQVITNWQRRVDHDLCDHQIAEINKQVLSWKLYNTKGSKHLQRLITGHHFLNSFQSHISSKITKYCTCGQVETLYHFLFTCQKYTRYRLRWLSKIFNITGNPDVLHHTTFKTAFGQRNDLSDSENKKLQESTCEYIIETQRFS